mgnify:CR=1 FL=1
MDAALATKIASHPKYQELKAKRTSFGWWLTLAMMVVYYGFNLLVAINKPFLSQRLGEGVRDGLKLGVGHAQPALRLTSISLTSACSAWFTGP